MSDIALNSNIYHSTRTYLELLNNFVIEMNYAPNPASSSKLNKVIEFLKRINSKTEIDPNIRLIQSYFIEYYENRKVNFDVEIKALIKRLEETMIGKDEIALIDTLIRILKDHCFQAHSRLRM